MTLAELKGFMLLAVIVVAILVVRHVVHLLRLKVDPFYRFKVQQDSRWVVKD